MGIELTFYWPGQTEEVLNASYEAGSWYDEKQMHEAICMLQYPSSECDEMIERLCARYDLDDLRILHPDPSQLDLNDTRDKKAYRPPENVAAAAERLAAAVAARDPDVKPIVKAYAWMYRSDLARKPPHGFVDFLHRLVSSGYRRESNETYRRWTTLTDRKWQECHDGLTDFAATARRIADQGVERVTLIQG